MPDNKVLLYSCSPHPNQVLHSCSSASYFISKSQLPNPSATQRSYLLPKLDIFQPLNQNSSRLRIRCGVVASSSCLLLYVWPSAGEQYRSCVEAEARCGAGRLSTVGWTALGPPSSTENGQVCGTGFPTTWSLVKSGCLEAWQQGCLHLHPYSWENTRVCMVCVQAD